MKKVLSLVLVLAMVLGSFSFVSAATPNDVVGTPYEKAVNRLALLEILKGYPDGSFKPENTITRAEFAAVAVRAKGLEDAANAAKGLATGFSDVTAGHWASGYVGTAARLGIVNGVGNGQFAPEAPVKYEEAITMLVRALGYEPSAKAKGGYPYGYLIVANEVGLLKEVKGTQGTAASRGVVAQIANNALEVAKMVQVGFGTDAKFVVSGSKEHGGEKELLLKDLGVDEIKGVVANNFRVKSTLKAREIEIGTKKFKVTEDVDVDAFLGAGVTAWAKDDVIFSVSLGYKYKVDGVEYVFDEEQVAYDALVKADSNDKVAYLTILDDEYDWAKRPTIYVNNKSVDADEIPNGAYGRFVFNEDEEVTFAYLFDIAPANTGLVMEIDKDDMNYVNLYADDDKLALDKAEEVYVFNKDLSKASLEDIKEGTAVFYWIDGDDNYYIIASNEVLEGNLDAVRVRDSRITVAGKNITYKEGNALFSSDDMDNFEVLKDFTTVEDYVDEDVVVYYNLVGRTLALVTDTDATSSTVHGIATWITAARNPVLSVYTVDGKEVDYTFEDNDDIPAAIKDNDFTAKITGVSFKVNKDGEIADGSFVWSRAKDTFVKDDNKKFGLYNGENLYITEDTVILRALNSSSKLKPSVIKYDNIIKKEVKTNNNAVVIKGRGNDLNLLVFTDAAFEALDSSEYGIVTSDPVRKGTDYKAKIDVFGKGEEEYVLSNDATAKGLRAGDLIKFKLSDKGKVVEELQVDLVTGRDSSSVYEVVGSKSGNYLTTNRGTYRVSNDTVFYSAKKAGSLDTRSSFGRLEKNDTVLLLANSDNELKVVLEITLYTGAKAGSTDVVTDGKVSYINSISGAVAAADVAIEVTDSKGNFAEYVRAEGDMSLAVAQFFAQAAANGNSTVLEGSDVKLSFNADGQIIGVKAVKLNANKTAASLTVQKSTALNGLAIVLGEYEINNIVISADDVTIDTVDNVQGTITGDYTITEKYTQVVTSMTVTQQPTNTVAGVAINKAPAVTVVDQYGFGIAGLEVSIVNESDFDDGTFTVTTNANGVATFNDLVIETAASGKKITFSVEGHANVDSNTFNVLPGKLVTITAFAYKDSNKLKENGTLEVDTLTGKDVYGNAIASVTGGTFTIVQTSGTGSIPTINASTGKLFAESATIGDTFTVTYKQGTVTKTVVIEIIAD